MSLIGSLEAKVIHKNKQGVMMKKLLLVILIVFFVSMAAVSQDTSLDNTTGEEKLPTDTGRQILRELSVDTFDDSTLWMVQMPIDRGVINVRRIVGSPKKKTPLRATEQLIQGQVQAYKVQDEYVFGVRADFFGRSQTQISIKAKRPVYVPGIVKKISLWVSGRGKGHEISLIIRDMKGTLKKLPMGLLDFVGWEQKEVVIPSHIDQDDVGGSVYGLYVVGLLIDTKFEDTVGRYYAYFDDMRAVSDVISELLFTSEDDIADGW